MIVGVGRLWVAVLMAMMAWSASAAAQEIRVYTKKAAFDDVKFELSNVIIGRGLTVDYTGQIGKMLERTGADLGASKPLYKQAEFMTFCSAKLSRAMMEADPTNVGYCPYVVFIYETVSSPGEIAVGYRRPMAAAGSDDTRKALADIDALLDGIVKDAVK
jgi:hypothetical protein